MKDSGLLVDDDAKGLSTLPVLEGDALDENVKDMEVMVTENTRRDKTKDVVK